MNNSAKNSDSFENESYVTCFEEPELDYTKIIVLSVMGILTLFGNALTFTAIIARKGKVSRMYFFLIHLSLADILTAFFSLLTEIIWTMTSPEFYGGGLLCSIIKVLQMVGPYLSSFLLCVTAIDRYQAICRPLENCFWNPTKSKIMVCIAWLLAFLCSLPQYFLFDTATEYFCSDNKEFQRCKVDFQTSFVSATNYILFYSCANFFFPLLLLTFLYTYICRGIWRSARSATDYRRRRSHENLQLQDLQNIPAIGECQLIVTFNNKNETRSAPRKHSTDNISRAKIRSVKLTLCVIITYILCSAPFIIGQIIVHFGSPEVRSYLESKLDVLLWLMTLNSVTNPWIYLLFNQNLLLSLKLRFLNSESPRNVSKNGAVAFEGNLPDTSL